MSPKNKPSGASAPQAGTSRREMLRQQQEAEAARQRRMRIIGIAAALVAIVLIAVVGTVAYNDHRTKVAAAAADGTPPDHNSDDSGIKVNPGKAKADAPTLVVYQDYQCPICKEYETALGSFTNDLAATGQINLEYRTMIFLDTNEHNDSSIRSGMAAACADFISNSAYEKMHDTIYANQPATEGQGYTDDQLLNTFPAQAGITGADLSKYQACYKAQATKAFVQGTDQKAAAAGITGTPTYKVNGKTITFGQQLPTTEAAWLALIKQTAA